MEGEYRAGGDREIFVAARTALNLASRAEVVPVRHAAVRADHFFAVAPALAAEQGKRIVLTHGQNLNYGQSTGLGSQEKM